MNIANKLTIFRIVLAPVFMVILLLPDVIPFSYLIAAILFSAASITDMLDGQIARRRGMITNFGKFLDPLADKILVFAALIGFMVLDVCPGMAYLTMVVLTREFLVTSIRLVASSGGKVIAASAWGKAKTVSQMIAIITVMVLLQLKDFVPKAADAVRILSGVLLWSSALLAVISGIHYLYINKALIDHKK